jgi:hypothetical protein
MHRRYLPLRELDFHRIFVRIGGEYLWEMQDLKFMFHLQEVFQPLPLSRWNSFFLEELFFDKNVKHLRQRCQFPHKSSSAGNLLIVVWQFSTFMERESATHDDDDDVEPKTSSLCLYFNFAAVR